MKNLVIGLSLFSLLFMGCADNKTMHGMEFETYGIVNKNEIRDECVKYKVSVGNMVWSVLTLQTLILPIYFVGYSLWEPESYKKGCITDKDLTKEIK